MKIVSFKYGVLDFIVGRAGIVEIKDNNKSHLVVKYKDGSIRNFNKNISSNIIKEK